MAYMLPSLNALRAFEAASRLRGFARAADELRVTPGAVSRHIHILEESLGVKLFVRLGRGIELTPVGTFYLEVIQDVFKNIDAATREISYRSQRLQIRLSVPPTLGSRWIVPRLPRYEELYPDQSLALVTSDNAVDFDSERVDISIETQDRGSATIQSAKLFDLKLIPVCNPERVNGFPPPTNFDELRRCTLLHTLNPAGLWEYWAEQVGFADLGAARSLSFQSSDLAYKAARDGLGVVLAVPRLVSSEIKARFLRPALDLPVVYPGAYFVNMPKVRLRQPAVARLFEWLLNEANTDS